ncbi:DUF1120 domain-containing protein [Herbaspirillum sp. RTI4]|uniref:DUF1120 domain-containing protein n=1 Tax=Herbaspirillum sp. RTI4 TaxID=3048640 RepID=UPI002AB4F2BF|nr:DUF1120 domain-containing protein [Herbaspirillum sp. RTI4]MDY7577727.1 DUF1120 domain-containing protein [Herbaspirillum sp. RTI4]MEA9980845.1 DUF1120 domain-containing protein [Herbaspirillum sp. RTI4]
MNRIQTLAGFVFLLSLFGSAGAADPIPPSAMLTATAKIKAPACNASVSGNIDYGVISHSLLNPTKTTQLKSNGTSLNITCESDTFLRFKVTDEKPGTAISLGTGYVPILFGSETTSVGTSNLLGLGKSTNGVPIGGYVLQFGTPTVVNSAGTSMSTRVIISATPAGSISGGGFAQTYYDRSTPYIGTATSSDGLTPAKGKTFLFPLAVVAIINKSTAFSATDTVELSGKITMEIVYL